MRGHVEWLRSRERDPQRQYWGRCHMEIDGVGQPFLFKVLARVIFLGKWISACDFATVEPLLVNM